MKIIDFKKIRDRVMGNKKEEKFLSEKDKKELRDFILNKVPEYSCPMCKFKEFSVWSYSEIDIRKMENSEFVGTGRVFRTFVVACNDCFMLTHHAIKKIIN